MRMCVLVLKQLLVMLGGWLAFALLFGVPVALLMIVLQKGADTLISSSGRQWAAVLFAALRTILFAGWRVAAGLRPRLLSGLLGRLFGAAGIVQAESRNNLPAAADVQPSNQPFRNPATVRQVVDQLTARGFVEVGTFDMAPRREVPFVLMAAPAGACGPPCSTTIAAGSLWNS